MDFKGGEGNWNGGALVEQWLSRAKQYEVRTVPLVKTDCISKSRSLRIPVRILRWMQGTLVASVFSQLGACDETDINDPGGPPSSKLPSCK